VQLLEERTLRAEEQVTRYARCFNKELDKQLAETRERLCREAKRELAGMRGDLVSELLEVLDNFDRSLAALPPDANDGVRQGLTLVREQFFGTLERQGLCEVDALGEIFDPTVHEAASITPVSDPAQDKRVMAVVKPGYRLASTLVRPALVRVGRLS
jgi:molecular chaperone GrpE